MLSGFGNYFVPLHDRRARHGLPAAERLRLLGLPRRGPVHVLELARSARRPTPAGSPTRRCRAQAFRAGRTSTSTALGLIFLGISTTAGAINFIVTILKLRAPGMSLNRMPLFCWAMLATSFAIVFAMPALTAACLLLELERHFGFHFFDVAARRRPAPLAAPLLDLRAPRRLHHLPAGGRDRLARSSRSSPGGRSSRSTWVALATMATGVHQLRRLGAPHVRRRAAAGLAERSSRRRALVIAIPSGIQVFAWLATMLGGRPVLRTPFLFVLGFIVVVRDRRVDRRDVRRGPVRPAGDRLVLRRRALPLRALRRRRVPDLRGDPLLVAEDHRPACSTSALGVVELLARLRRLQPHLLPDAHRRACSGCRGASTRIRPAMGWDMLQPALDDRRVRARASGSFVDRRERRRGACVAGAPAGDDPWGGDTLEWATSLAAARLQLRAHPDRAQRRRRSGTRFDRERGAVLPGGTQHGRWRPRRARRPTSRVAARCPESSWSPLLVALALSLVCRRR